jgi:hypothetical protein
MYTLVLDANISGTNVKMGLGRNLGSLAVHFEGPDWRPWMFISNSSFHASGKQPSSGDS